MLVTYPDACWCQLISPSITGLRHYRSGCVSIPCAGPPTSTTTRPTTHARAGPTPHRRFHRLCRTSNRAATTHISSYLPHARLNPGQNSPASICLHPKREKLSLHAQNSPNSRLLDERGDFVTDNAPKAPRPGTFCPTTSCMLTRSTTGSHVHRLLHRWAGATHGASEAWLRCPRAVAGPGSQDAEPDCRTHLIIPRGVTFVPGTAWPARPLDARAASYARRVASKPGQALQALRRPPQGRRLLSTLSWPCMPANSAYVQTRPRPVSRPRPRQ